MALARQPLFVDDAQDLKLKAQADIYASFKAGVLGTLSVFVDDGDKYLNDYFLLVHDLKARPDVRRQFHDFCFVLSPVHKLLEGYCEFVLWSIFRLPVSYKPNESVGHYLKGKENHKGYIETASKRLKLSFTLKEWEEMLRRLSDEWDKNRNQQSHFGLERIESLQQAEQVASSVFRELNLGGQLVVKEYIEPIVQKLKEFKEQKAKEEQEKVAAINGAQATSEGGKGSVEVKNQEVKK